MTISNPAFESTISRTRSGEFAAKVNSAPATQLEATGPVAVTPYAGEKVTRRHGLPGVVTHAHSMAIGDDQDSLVSTFAEEHVTEDGRVLTSVHYVYAATDDEGATYRIVTETEQFVAPAAGVYEATAHRIREGSAWERFDSSPMRISRERAATLAEQAAEDAHLYQSFFARPDQPWAGAPAPEHADALKETAAQLRGH